MEFREYEWRDTEVCEELRKRRMNVCCLQEVRWRGQEARSMVYGCEGWSGNSDGTGGVGVLVKEKLCEVVEVRRKSERVMTVAMVLEEEVVRKCICVYGLQREKAFL